MKKSDLKRIIQECITEISEDDYLLGMKLKDEKMVKQFVHVHSLNPIIGDIWNYGKNNLSVYPVKIIPLGSGKAGMKYNTKTGNRYVEIKVGPQEVHLYLFEDDYDDEKHNFTPRLIKSGDFTYKLFSELINWR